ncbi:MAG: C40 family peptidase [Bacillus sp. (in: Bacteria)]|nr:C40 family peptidase [Bacillus sp. (in: firmicutes)]
MVVSYISLTTEEAIAKYEANYNDYKNNELKKVKQYRDSYQHIKGSLADQIVERAIWYMEHGYTVYGHGYNSYHSDGVLDCSGFIKLVYGDFGFDLTGVAKKYVDIGKRVDGVYQKIVDEYWHLEGVKHLRPGDIFTWWKERSNHTVYIGHVGIYMGELEGRPSVICTARGTPTAIGIISSFKRWYGRNFYNVQRILPEGSWTPGIVIDGHEDRGPVIPKRYVLPPQKPIIMPNRHQ